MKSIQEVLVEIEMLQDCYLYPAQGLPKISTTHALPGDLLEFYRQCGGVSLYQSSAYSIEVVPPAKVTLANPKIIGISEEGLKALSEDSLDISWSWYIIAEGANAQYITIDLSRERLGRCYDSFWDRHATPGYSPIIAKSFTELLGRLVENRGKHWYWLQPEFQPYGDAYAKR